MNRYSRLMSTILITVAVALSIVGPTVGTTRPASPDESSQPPAKQNWSQATGDIGNTRYSALSQIDTSTVKNLGATWVSDKFDDGGTSRVTPVVHNGVMFVTSGAKVYALDAKTGKAIWKYQTTGGPVAARGLGPTSQAGQGIPNTQGVAVDEGKVFVGLTDAQMIALDEKTGMLIWRHNAAEDASRSQLGRLTASPVVANGVVFTCVAFNEGRYVGRAVALDTKDGHQLWRWDSVPGPGQPGHETWTTDPKSPFWKMGGADIWQPPVVDPDLGLVYYGTGNPSPNKVGAGVRPGNNLYSSSIVAIDIKTGKLRWYYQVIHHDLWEGDIATPLIMYDGEYEGRQRKGVAAMRPDGTLFFIDRATGKPIWPVEERAVRQSAMYNTSPTQPFPAGRSSLIERDCSHWKTPPGFVMRCEFFQAPSENPPNLLTYGPSTRSSPMSYSPQTGYFYVQGADRMDWTWNSSDPATWEFGSPQFLAAKVPNLYKEGVLVFEAVDPRTYKIVWRKEMRPPPSNYGTGGWLTTGGGLAFHRVEDGNLVAFDAKTGDELWKFQTGVIAGDTASPMSYEVDGQQYVSVIQDAQIWAFRLGGNIPQRPAPALPTQDEELRGQIQDTQLIRAAVPDEYNYKHDIGPLKARVKAGTDVTFNNNSSQVHTFVSDDGSWTTGTLLPRQIAILTFDKPGTYLYHCKEHPWSYGELIVTDANASANPAPATAAAPAQGGQGNFAAQAARGKDVYQQQCSTCHQADLSGSDMIPALAGSGFLARWQGKTAKDLFDRTRTTMPATAPGSLSPQAYMDLIAYMLQVNGISPARAMSADTLGATTLH